MRHRCRGSGAGALLSPGLPSPGPPSPGRGGTAGGTGAGPPPSPRRRGGGGGPLPGRGRPGRRGAGGNGVSPGAGAGGRGERRLAPLASSLDVFVARDEFVLTLRAPVEEWDRAWSAVRELLAGPPLSDAALTRARESQREAAHLRGGGAGAGLRGGARPPLPGCRPPRGPGPPGNAPGSPGTHVPRPERLPEPVPPPGGSHLRRGGSHHPGPGPGCPPGPHPGRGSRPGALRSREPPPGQEQAPLPAPSDSVEADSLEAAQASPSARIRPLVRPLPPPLRVPATPPGPPPGWWGTGSWWTGR
jgi:hypothetical protein